MPRILPKYWPVVTAMLLQNACAAKIEPPTTPWPVPGYVPVEASSPAAWDAVVDFLVDNGTEFDFISADMRVAKITVLLAPGPIGGPAERAQRPNPEAVRYADCGRSRGEPYAGWGNLIADVAVRVRPAESGSLVKVVIPRLRQTRFDGSQVPCVSKGVFEREAEAAIGERLEPIIKRSP